ncbi:hypothetical protein ABW21_db0204015 [Orbilia brochopaga]|nr:hypothetical protein ABW21_db0204015 [Drechslerella brochopaga]
MIHIYPSLTLLTSFLWLFLSNSCTSRPTNGQDDTNPERPGSANSVASSALSGPLGWRSEDWYAPYSVVQLELFLKRIYWQDDQVISEIETLLRGILDLYESKEEGRYHLFVIQPPRDGIRVPKYKNLGTPFISVAGKYDKLADIILDDFALNDETEIEGEQRERKRIGVADYLDAWGILGMVDGLQKRIWSVDAHLSSVDGDAIDRGAPVAPQRRGNIEESSNTESLGNLYKISEGADPQRPAVLKRNPAGTRSYSADLIRYDIAPGSSEEEWHSHQHTFSVSEGQGIDIFVLDTGFADNAIASPEFSRAIRNGQIKGFYWAQGTQPHGPWMDFADPYPGRFHGTMVISKIIGETTGWARKANIWVEVMLDMRRVAWIGYLTDCLNAALEKIDMEIERDPNYKAIISMSSLSGYHRVGDELDRYPDSFISETEKKFIDASSRLADIVLDMLGERRDNVIIVCGPGNGNLGRPISAWPAKRGDSIENLVGVGSADLSGKIKAYSKTEFIKVYGISDNILVPRFERLEAGLQWPVPGRSAFQWLGGISLAIPVIAGILATHLSDHPDWSIKQAIDKLYNDAYPRAEGPDAVPIAWTGNTLIYPDDNGHT